MALNNWVSTSRKNTVGIIRLNNIQIHAFHGCLPQEAKVGGQFRVDVAIHYNFNDAVAGDDLTKTVDYVKVNQVVQHEMAIRAKLIESVLERILGTLKGQFPAAEKIWVRVTKIAAPMSGQVESVSVENEI
jgi:dihydroneopterin aldolase